MTESWFQQMQRAGQEQKDPPPAALKGSTLVAEDLAKDYGDGFGLSPLKLKVDAGELIMLVGPNGAGKSTFLGLCSGLLEPSEGSVWIAGAEAGSLEARAATSLLPDQPVLYEDLTVNEHLEYIARLHQTSDWDEYADDLLDMFNLTDRADDLPSRFSRGLRQKTALICGLIRPFRLLLIDEPFAGLDRPAQEVLVEILGDLVQQDATIVCSTHQLDLLEVATRCVGLQDGAKVFDGKPSEAKVRELVGG